MIVLLCVSVIGIPFFIIFYFLLLYFKKVGKGKHSTCSGTIILVTLGYTLIVFAIYFVQCSESNYIHCTPVDTKMSSKSRIATDESFVASRRG